jgi:hypothetical protein
MNRHLAAALFCTLLVAPLTSNAAEPTAREPYGINLEGFAYPYPVNLLPLVDDGEQLRMAYMDVQPPQANGRTVMLLHGRNFPSSYWAPVIKTLIDTVFASWCRTRSALANPQNRLANCTSIRWRATPSPSSIICKSTKPTSSRIRWAACSLCGLRAPIPTASIIWC